MQACYHASSSNMLAHRLSFELHLQILLALEMVPGSLKLPTWGALNELEVGYHPTTSAQQQQIHPGTSCGVLFLWFALISC